MIHHQAIIRKFLKLKIIYAFFSSYLLHIEMRYIKDGCKDVLNVFSEKKFENRLTFSLDARNEKIRIEKVINYRMNGWDAAFLLVTIHGR